MHSSAVPSHAWRACLLAAASASAPAADAQVANSHVARSWVGTWDTAAACPSPLNDQTLFALRLQAVRNLLAQQTDRRVGSGKAAAVANGARPVIVLFGIGDIGAPANPAACIDDLIASYRQLIARAHARGLAICGATMTPFEGAIKPGHDMSGQERVRQGANDWIRNGAEFDAVIDFDRALRDPRQPARMLPAFDSGDHLHPNEAGQRAMACAIPQALFAPPAQAHQLRATP